MKKVIFIIALSLAIISCSKVAKGEFILSGEAKGIPNGQTVFLKQKNTNGIVISVDSTKIKDGKFQFKGKANELNMSVVFIKGLQQPIPFILETGEIEVKIDKDSIWKSEIGGTFNNDAFQKFNTKRNEIQKRLVDYQNNTFQKYIDARKKNDLVTVKNLELGFEKIQKENDEFMSKFPKENKDTYISLLLIEDMFNSPKFNLENVKKLYNDLDESLKATTVGKGIEAKLKAIETNNKIKPENALIGKLAPDFSAKTPQGKTVSLKESLGKITIIDFWASWCGPCRQENPNMVALYTELHSKGLNVIGVSLDNDINEWNKAIAKDKITWTQVSTLKRDQDPISGLYGVEQIPSTFILDASGIVIAKDLRGEELRAKIKELLNVK